MIYYHKKNSNFGWKNEKLCLSPPLPLCSHLFLSVLLYIENILIKGHNIIRVKRKSVFKIKAIGRWGVDENKRCDSKKDCESEYIFCCRCLHRHVINKKNYKQIFTLMTWKYSLVLRPIQLWHIIRDLGRFFSKSSIVLTS